MNRSATRTSKLTSKRNQTQQGDRASKQVDGSGTTGPFKSNTMAWPAGSENHCEPSEYWAS